MVAGRFEPMFPVELVAKDFGYALAMAEEAGGALPVAERVSERLARAVAQGLGGQHLTALVRLHR